MSEKTISRAVISRLPRYYRCLEELVIAGKDRVSSTELAEMMKVTASQIRQDLNTFGGFGQQGYGYNVRHLFEEMGKILGLDRDHKMIVVGAGNLARAFTHYSGFKHIGFHIVGLFDNNPAVIGKPFNELPVMPMQELASFVQKENVEIGILAVPWESAKDALSAMLDAGIKNIWNFVPGDLGIEIPDDVIIESEHLSDSLIQLSYVIKATRKENETV